MLGGLALSGVTVAEPQPVKHKLHSESLLEFLVKVSSLGLFSEHTLEVNLKSDDIFFKITRSVIVFLTLFVVFQPICRLT